MITVGERMITCGVYKIVYILLFESIFLQTVSKLFSQYYIMH